MNLSFNEIYLELNKKERAAVLFAVKSFNYDYPNIHMGQISFLNINTVRYNMGELLTYSKNHEDVKSKPEISSKICEVILEKLLVTFEQKLITLDELKVKSQTRQFLGSETLYVTYVPIFKGRISCRVELRPHKKNMFYVTTKKTHLTEAIQQLTYKFGLYSNQ